MPVIQITATYFLNVIYFILYNIEEEYLGEIIQNFMYPFYKIPIRLP